jgi:hypothetical protein
MPEIEYPNVQCSVSGHEPAPGYAVCIHVMAGLPVVHHDLPTPEGLGTICCVESPKAHTIDEITLYCNPSATREFLNREIAHVDEGVGTSASQVSEQDGDS